MARLFKLSRDDQALLRAQLGHEVRREIREEDKQGQQQQKKGIPGLTPGAAAGAGNSLMHKFKQNLLKSLIGDAPGAAHMSASKKIMSEKQVRAGGGPLADTFEQRAMRSRQDGGTLGAGVDDKRSAGQRGNKDDKHEGAAGSYGQEYGDEDADGQDRGEEEHDGNSPGRQRRRVNPAGNLLKAQREVDDEDETRSVPSIPKRRPQKNQAQSRAHADGPNSEYESKGNPANVPHRQTSQAPPQNRPQAADEPARTKDAGPGTRKLHGNAVVGANEKRRLRRIPVAGPSDEQHTGVRHKHPGKLDRYAEDDGYDYEYDSGEIDFNSPEPGAFKKAKSSQRGPEAHAPDMGVGRDDPGPASHRYQRGPNIVTGADGKRQKRRRAEAEQPDARKARLEPEEDREQDSPSKQRSAFNRA